ncbi:MAG: O-antigen ligase family protein [bacterium]|nr:O-antigen ligase family protein [bacterium]
MQTNLPRKDIETIESGFIIKWITVVVVSFLTFLGTANSTFSIAALGCAAYSIVFGDENESIVLLVAIAPFATILKLQAGSTSFYTYLLLLYVLKSFYQKGSFDIFAVVFVLYFVIMQMINMNFDITISIKMFANLCFLDLAYERYSGRDTRGVFYAYILGVVFSSVFMMLDSSFFRVSEIVDNINTLGKQFGNGDEVRFAGCYGDPNYYSVNLVLALCLIVLLLNQGKIKSMSAIGLTAFFVYCAYITYSKSAYVMLAFPLMLYMYSEWKKGRIIKPTMMIVGIFLLMLIILQIKPDLFDIILERFGESGAGGSAINSLTTGRTDIWGYYLEYFVRHPLKTIFGSGMCGFAEVRGRAAHNTFIEMLFHLGIVGSLLLIAGMRSVFEAYHIRHEYSFINRCIPISIMIMYAFLSELFMSDPPIHMFLAFLSMDMPHPDERCKGRMIRDRRRNEV